MRDRGTTCSLEQGGTRCPFGPMTGTWSLWSGKGKIARPSRTTNVAFAIIATFFRTAVHRISSNHPTMQQVASCGNSFGRSRAKCKSRRVKGPCDVRARRPRRSRELVEFCATRPVHNLACLFRAASDVGSRVHQDLCFRASPLGQRPFSRSRFRIVEVFVGVGHRVRDMFEQAKKQAPASYSLTRLTRRPPSRAGLGGPLRRDQTLHQFLSR